MLSNKNNDPTDDDVDEICCTSHFEQLPKEIIGEIVMFLVGDLNWLHRIDVRLATEVTTRIPSFENIKSLIQFVNINQKMRKLIMGNSDEAFERFWLKGFVFYQKVLYWIRTKGFDALDLCTGDLNATEMDEAFRIETIIQGKERGKSKVVDFNNVATILDNPLNMDSYCDESTCTEMIQSRFNQFNISFEDYERYHKPTGSSFDMFLTQSLILSLEMYKNMGSENSSEYSSHENDLLPQQKMEYWPNKSYMTQVKMLVGKKVTERKIGIRIESSSGWYQFVKNNTNNQKTEFSSNESNGKIIHESKTNIDNKDGTIYIFCVLLAMLSYWSPYFLLASPFLYLFKYGGWFNTRSTTSNSNTSVPEEKITIDEEPIEEKELRERLSGSILLSFVNVFNLDPLKNFEFPSSIRFLSIDCFDWSKKKGLFFNGCTFPGVKYLTISFEQEDYYYDNQRRAEAEKRVRQLLEEILSSNVVPNLKNLVLSGVSISEYLFHQIEFLKQLHNIDILFDYNSRNTNGWINMCEFTSRLSQLSKCLKYVVVETNLDPRENGDQHGATHKSIQEFYDNHDCPVSVGTFSVSRYYYSSYE